MFRRDIQFYHDHFAMIENVFCYSSEKDSHDEYDIASYIDACCCYVVTVIFSRWGVVAII